MFLLAVIARHQRGAYRAVLWIGRTPVAASSEDAQWPTTLGQLREVGLALTKPLVGVSWVCGREIGHVPLAFQDPANGNAELAGDGEHITEVRNSFPPLEARDHRWVSADAPR